jgi:hypothetical protein
MSVAALDTVIDRQAELIAALDGRDAAAIERATSALADAVGALQRRDVWRDEEAISTKIDYGLKQVTAASIRVNALSHWTRQRIDQLADIRGDNTSNTYKIKKKHQM